ncbi:MAG TPA: PhnD/SsuA/transferrin family substrate-binding protein [Myxococcota bacterium]|nr:PhnD/SsuA/transferrin family substrate-binding protein [Myxococcota bacterium]
MKNMLACILAGLVALLIIYTPAGARAAGTIDILVCYPGGSVRARDAEPALKNMVAVIESIGGWPAGTIKVSFTTKVAACRKLLDEKKPEFAIVSLGLFLENRVKHHLVPLARPKISGRDTDKYRILVRKGSYANIEALKGKTLGGQWLTEPEFLRRIVFKGKLDPARYFKLSPSRRALRALRELSRGKLDAVIVNELQYGGLSALPFGKGLAVAFASDEMPQMGVVADEKKADAADRARMRKALDAMCKNAEGKKLCTLFGIDAFVPSSGKTYQAVIDLYQGGK